MSKQPALLQIANWASVPKSTLRKHDRKILREVKKTFPKEIDMYKLRVGKTTYFFEDKERLQRRLKMLDTCVFDYAEPGDELPVKLKL